MVSKPTWLQLLTVIPIISLLTTAKNYFNGKVGVGTTDPSSQLSVRGSKSYTGTTPSDGSFDFHVRSNTCTVGIGSYNGIPTIQGSGSGTSYNLALCPANGAVGVGIETPTEKLDVNGNLRSVVTLLSTVLETFSLMDPLVSVKRLILTITLLGLVLPIILLWLIPALTGFILT